MTTSRFKNNPCLILFSCLFALFVSFKCVAFEEEYDDFEEVRLYAAQPKTLPAANPKRVVVTKPEIVDVHSVSANEVVLEPKSAGMTTLLIWDDYGQHSYMLKVFNEDLSQLKRHADSLLRELNVSRLQIKINEAEAKLLLVGEADSLDEKERVLSTLSSLRDKILDLATIKEERNLVKIDMQILEINRDDIKKLGLDYTDSTLLTDNANTAMNKITDMFATSKWSRARLNVTINHLISVGKIRVLSRPKLVCLSGKEAEFVVGGQFPIPKTTTTQTSTTSETEFKDYGINLKIKPVVKDEDDVLLSISNEIIEIDTSVDVSGSVPAFSTRNTKTELYIKSGNSLVISGLIKNLETDTVEKFPGMADLPILGVLFRSKNFQQKQTELVILLTPEIVSGSSSLEGKDIPSGSITHRYENKADKALSELNGKDEKRYPASLDSYIDDIKNQIVSSIGYPSLARELGVSGTVKVRLRILSDGWLKEALVVGSSGSELLDNSTIRSIKKLAPFSSFPGSLERNEIAVDIPIVYN
ncbi:MAG: TonB family protein [Candidatus Omnitrophota bacterium]